MAQVLQPQATLTGKKLSWASPKTAHHKTLFN
jgi:hypothetical protein